jgi:hypothetical protein
MLASARPALLRMARGEATDRGGVGGRRLGREGRLAPWGNGAANPERVSMSGRHEPWGRIPTEQARKAPMT